MIIHLVKAAKYWPFLSERSDDGALTSSPSGGSEESAAGSYSGLRTVTVRQGESLKSGASLEDEAMWVQLWIPEGSEIQAHKARQLEPSTTEIEESRYFNTSRGPSGPAWPLLPRDFYWRYYNEIAIRSVFTLFNVHFVQLFHCCISRRSFFSQSYVSWFVLSQALTGSSVFVTIWLAM